MADATAIIGAVGGIVGILSGGGVIQLWRTWRQERREQHHDFWATYDKQIELLERQHEREPDPDRKTQIKQRLDIVADEYHDQLEAYRQSSALRQTAPRGAISAAQPPLAESEVSRLRELLDRAEPLSPALLTSDDYFSRANALYAAGDFEKALAAYNRALELTPDHPDVLHNRGFILYTLRRYDEALTDFNRAVELNSDDPTILITRAITLYHLQRHGEALADISRAVELRPDHAGTLYNSACLLSLMGRLPDSWKQLKEAISRDAKYRKMAREDEDFDNLRSDPTLGPEFQRLVAEPDS